MGDCVIGLSTTGVAGPGLMEINRQVLHMSVVPCRRGSEVFALGERRLLSFACREIGESVRRGVVHCILQKAEGAFSGFTGIIHKDEC